MNRQVNKLHIHAEACTVMLACCDMVVAISCSVIIV